MPMNPRLLRPRQNIGWESVSRDIVGFWPLEDVADTSGNGLHLDLSSNQGTSFSTSTFKVGAGSLTCSDDYSQITYSTAPAPFGNDFTLSGWYRSVDFAQQVAILFTGDDAVYVTRYENFIRGSAGGDEVALNANATSGDWVFFCLRRQGSTTRLWINGGAKIAQESFTLPITNSFNNLYFLGDPNSNFFSENGGNLDAVGLWRRALSDAEVNFLYNGGLGREYAAPSSE